MSKSRLITMLISLVLLTAVPARAQTDPCSLESILSSYRAAALSDSIELWRRNFIESDMCSLNVRLATGILERAYSVLTIEDGLVDRWIGIGESSTTSLDFVTLDLEFIDLQQFEGRFRWKWSNDDPYAVTVRGSYTSDGSYSELVGSPAQIIWDQVGYDLSSDDIIAWFAWERIEIVEGSPNDTYVQAAVVTLDGVLYGVSYSSNGQNGWSFELVPDIDSMWLSE